MATTVSPASFLGSSGIDITLAPTSIIPLPTQQVSPTGVASAEAHGAGVIGHSIMGTGFTDTPFGLAVIKIHAAPSAIASAEAFGVHAAQLGPVTVEVPSIQ